METDIDQEWLTLISISVEKLHAKNSDWSQLSEQDQDMAALWKLEADMNNGGFMQFFCNWGIDCYNIAIGALRKIDALKMLAIVEAEFQIIDNIYERSKGEMKEYWDLPKHSNEADRLQLDRLDEEFWDYPDNISALGLAFYKPSQNN